MRLCILTKRDGGQYRKKEEGSKKRASGRVVSMVKKTSKIRHSTGKGGKRDPRCTAHREW